MRYVALMCTAVTLLLGAAIPAQAEEPMASHCLTADVKKLHIQMTERFENITAFVNEDSPAEIQEAYNIYKNGMDIAWSAISDPYCGYGTNYSGVPSRLYLKTVNRIHDKFVHVMNEAVNNTKVDTENETLIQKNADQEEPATIALRYGMRGPAVLELQKSLIKIPGLFPEKLTTGFFGSATQRAIIRLQRRYDLFKNEEEKSGIVGQATWNKIKELLAEEKL